MDIGDKVEHRPVNGILIDLTEARIAREKVDKMLEDVLTQLELRPEGDGTSERWPWWIKPWKMIQIVLCCIRLRQV